MGVCLVVCSCGQYTGLCVFGALRKVASILAFAGLRVKAECHQKRHRDHLNAIHSCPEA